MDFNPDRKSATAFNSVFGGQPNPSFETTIGSPMQPFYSDVTQAFDTHAASNEFVKFHGYEAHQGEPAHYQTMLINTNGNCAKIKSY